MNATARATGWAICEAQIQDVDAIVALERTIENAARWRREAYAQIARPVAGEPVKGLQRFLMVAKDLEGRVLGFAVGCMHLALPDSAMLENVGVAPTGRRGGVGRALCEEVILRCRREGATEISLEVRTQSLGAIALYRSLGFVAAGIRPAYYADPADDAVVMRMDLATS